MAHVSYPVTFNDTEITTINGVTVLAVMPHEFKRRLSLERLASVEGRKLSSGFYDERQIVVRIGINRNTRALAEQSYDSLLGVLQGFEKRLIIPQGLNYRRYTATLEDTVIRVQGGMYIESDLIFQCSDPFGYDLSATSPLIVTSTTTPSRSDNFTIDGSAKWQLPVITIRYTSVTDGTSKTVNVGNGLTGQSVAITRTFSANDVVEIDAVNRTVKVNGAIVAYTGSIPQYAKGTNYFTYSDNMTSRTMNILVQYYRRWV